MQALVASPLGVKASQNDVLMLASDPARLQGFSQQIQQTLNAAGKPITLLCHALDLGDLDKLEGHIDYMLTSADQVCTFVLAWHHYCGLAMQSGCMTSTTKVPGHAKAWEGK